MSLRTNHPSDQLVVILPLSHGLDLSQEGPIFCSCCGRRREELGFNLRHQPRIIYLWKPFQSKSVCLGLLSLRLSASLEGQEKAASSPKLRGRKKRETLF